MATSLIKRIQNIEASLAEIMGELEEVEGERKEALTKLVERARQTLKRLKRHTLH